VLWSGLKKKKLVEMKESFFEKGNGCFVMEYCFKGDLNTLIKKQKMKMKLLVKMFI
jgi:hypothetical protein